MTGKQTSSPRLKAAMEEIKVILTKYDIASHIILADGEGLSEFLLGINPSWSCVYFENDKTLRFRARSGDFVGGAKTRNEVMEKTANMLVHFKDNLGVGYVNIDSVLEQLSKVIEIVEDEDGPILTPHK